MQVGNLTREYQFSFLGDQFIDDEGNDSPLPWRKKVTGSTPANVKADAAGVKLELTSFSGAQSGILHFNDILSFDIDLIQYIDFVWQLNMTSTTADVAFGLASNGKGDDAVTDLENALLFRVNANSLKLQAMSRLGTDTAVSQVSNQVVGGGEILRSRIDFETGVKAFSEVATAPKAGKGAVNFQNGDPTRGRALEQLVSKQFDLSGYSGGLQPVAVVAKTSGTDTAVLNIKEICVGVNVA